VKSVGTEAIRSKESPYPAERDIFPGSNKVEIMVIRRCKAGTDPFPIAWTAGTFQKEWEAMIAEYRSNGQSVKTWCAAHNVKTFTGRPRAVKLFLKGPMFQRVTIFCPRNGKPSWLTSF